MTYDAVEKPEVMSSREALALLTDERARQAHPFLVGRAVAAVVAHEARAACWHGAAELARADADAAEGRRALERSDREEAHALALAAERVRYARAGGGREKYSSYRIHPDDLHRINRDLPPKRGGR
jgi:hypothetical protein